jgi:hypothetical protein
VEWVFFFKSAPTGKHIVGGTDALSWSGFFCFKSAPTGKHIVGGTDALFVEWVY